MKIFLIKYIYVEELLKNYKLNERQFKALFCWKNEKQVTNAMYSNIFNITDRTALRDLNDLVNKGLLFKTGEKRKTKYFFNL